MCIRDRSDRCAKGSECRLFIRRFLQCRDSADSLLEYCNTDYAENLIRENADGKRFCKGILTFLLPKQGAVPFPAQRPVFFVSTGKF